MSVGSKNSRVLGLDRVFEELVRKRGREFLENLFGSAEKDIYEMVKSRVVKDSGQPLKEDIKDLQRDINNSTRFKELTIPETALLYMNVESILAKKHLKAAEEIHDDHTKSSIKYLKDMWKHSEVCLEMSEECLETIQKFDLLSGSWSYRPEHLAFAIHDFEDEGELANSEKKRKVVDSIGVMVEEFVEHKNSEVKEYRKTSLRIKEDARIALEEHGHSESWKDQDLEATRNRNFSVKEYKRNHSGKWF